MSHHLTLLAAVAAALPLRGARADADELFRERVRPLLEARCFECHGPAARRIRGDLRMSDRAALLAGGASGPAIVPGDPDASLLVRAVRWEAPDLEMPPDERLPPEEVALLAAWVAEGAPWPADDELDEEERAALAFFEQEVRPLLAERCFRCHGPDVDEPESELRMSGRSALLRGGLRGAAVVPGDPSASLLLRAVSYADSGLAMPPTGKLEPREIDVLERWIALGAPFPEERAAHEDEPGIDVDAGRSWWAFRPVARPAVPDVADASRVANPIDAFVLARLEAAGIAPNPTAGDRELVRRAWFDLLGLPPTAEEVEAYVADPAPDKWERLVDRLLASPRYGERQGRAWLDVVRFGQTNGYERDAEKPFAWRYRDWVIDALNRDLPYDRFLMEQLAGDELDDAGPGAVVATGFYHLGAWDSEPDDEEQAVWDGYDDVLRVIGEGMLGVTVGCARCHDHRFDPVRQSDYFGMAAFVRNVRPYAAPEYSLESPTLVPLGSAREVSERLERDRAERAVVLDQREEELLGIARERLLVKHLGDRSEPARAAHATPPAQRTPEQNQLLREVARFFRGDLGAELTPAERIELFRVRDERANLSHAHPGGVDWALAAREAGREPLPTHVQARGRADTPLEPVAPTFLPVLCPDDGASVPPAPVSGERSTGLRRRLAEWIASPAHPTTARVAANRVWQRHFGRGIVPTPNDFGATGAPPTHPELLDWLASELVGRGWSLKELHRLVMGSNAYRASSRALNRPALAADPGNDLLWRQRPRRLDAEALRDALLSVSDSLRFETGGRGFFPVLGREALAGASRPGNGWGHSTVDQRDRRAVYAFVKRGLVAPMAELFDFPDPALPAGERARTTTPSQAFTLLNGGFASRAAAALARRVRAEVGDDPRAQVERLFERALARRPLERELALALGFLERQAAAFAELPATLRLAARVPPRLQSTFLTSLPADGFLFGPREGWLHLRGRWGGFYNDTLERDRERGPAVLLDEPVFADGQVALRFSLEEGCEVAAFALRARAEGDELAGLQVVIDPEREEARLLATAAGGELLTLAARELELAPSTWHDLAVEAAGRRVTVVLDGELLLESDDAPVLRAGAFGVRTFGDGLSLADVEITTGGRTVAVPPEDRGTPAERALELLCLTAFNLNEFLYVD